MVDQMTETRTRTLPPPQFRTPEFMRSVRAAKGKFSREQKIEVVRDVIAYGLSYIQASKKWGAGKGAVSAWCKRFGPELIKGRGKHSLREPAPTPMFGVPSLVRPAPAKGEALELARGMAAQVKALQVKVQRLEDQVVLLARAAARS